jgi:hypothetical protein
LPVIFNGLNAAADLNSKPPLMASLYRRKRSPFWWLEYKKDGVRKLESTGLRYENELQTAQARLILAAWKAREAKQRSSELRSAISNPTFDWSWVDEWLDSHCKSFKTRSAYDLRGRSRINTIMSTSLGAPDVAPIVRHAARTRRSRKRSFLVR